MRVVLDTDVCIDFLKGQSPSTSRHVEAVVLGDIEGYCSVVTLAELVAGCRTEMERREVDALLGRLTILPIGVHEAERAGQLRHRFGATGLRLPDAFIAATSVVHRLPLLTRNLRHFQSIEDLDLFPH